VAEVVTDVREVGGFGLEAFDNGEGLFDGGVGGVGFVAEGVEEEDVEIAEFVHGVFGDLVVIGEVGDLADAVAEDDEEPVVEGDGSDLLAEEFEGFAVEDVNGEAGDGVFPVAIGEDVFEDAADDDEGGLGGVNGDGAALAVVEGAEVVEAEDVVGVGVGIRGRRRDRVFRRGRDWVRKSGEVSMTTFLPAKLSQTEARRRLSRGSVEVQTSQSQPMEGTPTLVPEPRTVRVT
jgi:hypothetical protein